MAISERHGLRKQIEADVLHASRRRCCLCVFLNDHDAVQKGQIAHLNRDRSDSAFENLIWLCLEHHDEYDSRTSQSKGFNIEEVRRYRDDLYSRNGYSAPQREEISRARPAERIRNLLPTSDYEILRKRFSDKLAFTTKPWRYPLWQVADEPDLFAYKAGNRADGVCLIERVDLPDGRIVIACIQTGGNPGNSITNCVEDLCFQVCERFDIPADQLVWLEHYDYGETGEWDWVTFGTQPPDNLFTDPKWTEMTSALWNDLRIRPKKRLTRVRG